MNTKIGVGVITCDRPEYLKNLINSLNGANVDKIYIINDGQPLSGYNVHISSDKNVYVHEQKPSRQGVAKAKNQAMRYLLKDGCEYIFIIEDDVVIKNKDVFSRYIEASKATGIQHFNYGPGTPFNRKQNVEFDIHNRHQLNQNSEPNPRLIVDYGQLKVALYMHVAGMFSFYTKTVLEKVGLMDEQFYNAWDHVDHTYCIIKAGYHPPFWWFADIENSHEYIAEFQDAIQKSTISKNTDEWYENMHKGRELYFKKHGHYPNQPPNMTENDVIQTLKTIKNG